MDPRLYLQLAEVLIKDAHDQVLLSAALQPVACRSAISRAYYAAFLIAHDFLDHIKVRVGHGPQTHVTVQHALNNSGHPTLALMSSKLGTLHSERLAADYDLVKSNPEKPAHATMMLSIAREVIENLDQLVSGAPAAAFDASAAAQAILKWAAVTGKANVQPKGR
jgi:hypothetical protein